MVFSSIPAYLDPTNWQQPSNHQAGNSSVVNQLLQPPPISPAQPHAGGGPGAAAYIRPGSMTERARLANIPMPEAPQKCPRCESANTKFCYFNNYSLTQPRHFCKSCRRYWTRGGAIRNVPVGGGCRRNKRTKATRSKSPVSSDRQTTSSSTTNTNVSSNSTDPANILGLLRPQIPPLSFLSPLSQLSDHYNAAGDVSEMNFQVGPNNLLGCGILGGGVASLLPIGAGAGGIEQWRLLQQAQQFPFLGGLESTPAGLYSQFQASTIVDPSGFVGETSHSQVRPKLSTSMLTDETSVKMEENHQEINFSRQLMGIPGNIQWTPDLTGFSSACTSNPL